MRSSEAGTDISLSGNSISKIGISSDESAFADFGTEAFYPGAPQYASISTSTACGITQESLMYSINGSIINPEEFTAPTTPYDILVKSRSVYGDIVATKVVSIS